MKHCPTCNRTFSDQHLSFCTDDGTPLVTVDAPEDEATVVRSSPGEGQASAGAKPDDSGPGNVPPYQPPGSYTPRDYPGQKKRRTWPWVVGILAALFLLVAGLGIAAVILIPNMMRAASNSRNLNANNQRSGANDRNAYPNSNARVVNENSNYNSAIDENTSAPTDEAAVLRNLTDLEEEWTVANVNADKRKLDRILADDYVGESPDGKRQGKAEYLRTATPDTSIQKWNFQDLKLSLKGDRATLNGIINLEVTDERGQNRDLAFRFTDKFVWRDGRWQATGSVVTPLKEGTAA